MIGLIVALLGIGLMIYSVLGSTRIGAGGTSGIGVVGPVQLCPGILLIVAGIVVFILSKPKLK